VENWYLQKLLLQPEAAFEGGKWGDRPRPRFFLKKTVVHKQEKILSNEKTKFVHQV
jgi:hypothetical protein